MIPRANITAWRAVAPWPIDAQVEQDLVISRALVALYSHPAFRDALAFRGGTALHKLLLAKPGRYSEDIDLVQTEPGTIGPALDAIREALDPWLGTPGRKQTKDGTTLLYRFESSGLPTQPMRLKVEINTREHGSVEALTRRTFRVDNPWFTGSAQVLTYSPTELLGTKLRALYQRKKGRDLFDLWQALTQLAVDDAGVVRVFGGYLERAGLRVTRAQFERNLAPKERMPEFCGDCCRCCRETAPTNQRPPCSSSGSASSSACPGSRGARRQGLSREQPRNRRRPAARAGAWPPAQDDLLHARRGVRPVAAGEAAAAGRSLPAPGGPGPDGPWPET